MGSGGSQEAPYDLKASVPAGTYHCIIDAVIIRPVDVTFDLVWRHGGSDTTLATWTAHYDPLGAGNFDAQPFEYDEATPTAIDFHSGDQLVFRYTGANTDSNQAYIPNGDGATSHGRIPSFTLPK